MVHGQKTATACDTDKRLLCGPPSVCTNRVSRAKASRGAYTYGL